MHAELITVPGTGTRTIERYLTKTYGFKLLNFPWKSEFDENTLVSTHFEPDRRGVDRLLASKNVLIFSTWRDPLRTVIHNMYKGRKHIMTCFVMLQELRAKRPVLMIDLKCMPYQEGLWETLRPAGRVADDDNALRKAYDARDLEYIDKVIPDYLRALREFDWKDLWTEEWWR
jgi:hypothetical protein